MPKEHLAWFLAFISEKTFFGEKKHTTFSLVSLIYKREDIFGGKKTDNLYEH